MQAEIDRLRAEIVRLTLPANAPLAVDPPLDRKAYQKEWLAKKRAAAKASKPAKG
jgi:hypothetical protein